MVAGGVVGHLPDSLHDALFVAFDDPYRDDLGVKLDHRRNDARNLVLRGTGVTVALGVTEGVGEQVGVGEAAGVAVRVRGVLVGA